MIKSLKSSSLKVTETESTVTISSSKTLQIDSNASSASTLKFGTGNFTENGFLIQSSTDKTETTNILKVDSSSNLIINGNILPETANTFNIGSSENKLKSIYATDFYGTSFHGIADEASKVTNNIKFTDGSTEIEYDGSQSNVVIDIASLGGIASISTPTNTSSVQKATAFTSVSVSKNGTESVLTFTNTPIVSGISSNLLLITKDASSGNVTIAPHADTTTKEDGKLYASSTVLYYAGNFDVTKQLTVNGTPVALTKAQTYGTKDNTILVKDTKTGNYGFVESNYTIKQSESEDIETTNTEVPTLQLVNEKINNKIQQTEKANASTEKTAVIKIPTNSTSGSTDLARITSTNAILIKNISVKVEEAYSKISDDTSPIIRVFSVNSTYATQEDIDLTEAGLYIVDQYIRETSLTDNNLTVTVEMSQVKTDAGSVYVYINYTEVQ